MRIRSRSIYFGKRGLYRLAIFALAISLALQALLPISVFAYTNTVDTSSIPIGAVNAHIRKVSEMYMVAACFRYAKINNTSPDQNVEKGDIFYSGLNSSTTASLGAYLTGKQGTAARDWTGSDSFLADQLSNCDHGQDWLKPIANDLGYNGQDWAVQVACAASFYRGTSNNQSKGLYGNACLSAPATYNFYQANDQNKNAQDFIKATSAKIGGGTLSPEEQYLYNVNTLIIGCGGTDSGKQIDTTKTDTLYAQQQRQIADGTGAGVTIISGSGNSAKTINEFYTFGSSAQHPTGSQSTATVQQANLSRVTYGMETGADQSKIPVACSDLLANANKYAPRYLTAVTKGQLQNKQTSCTSNGSADNSSNCPSSSGNTSCAVDGIGWIVCPVMNFMATLNDTAYSAISKFLDVKPDLTTNADVQTTWNTFRDIANVVFVIVFMIIIYSQITSVGIGNYGIKKLLPKIIIAAILVNVSIYVCQAAVDISNIVGNSIYGLFKNIPTSMDANSTFATTWVSVIGTILTLAASAALLVAVVLAPAALIAIAAALLILIAREAAIILLIILSPLAFVALLLPNTESWFKKWWKMFSSLLLVYPVIGAVFGASYLAGHVLAGSTDPLMKLASLGVMAVPLLAVPLLLKGALSGLGTIGAKISSLQGRANKMAMRNVKNSRLGEFKAAHDARKQQNRVNTRLGQGRMTRAGKFLERRGFKGVGSKLQQYDVAQIGAGFDKTKAGRYLGGDRGAAGAVFEQNKLNNEAVERSMALLENDAPDKVIGNALTQLKAANDSGDIIGARAATRILATKTGSRGIDELHAALGSMEDSNGDLHTDIDSNVRAEVNGASLKGKDRALDRWSRKETTTTTTGAKGRDLKSHDSSWETSRGLNESELAGHSITQLRKMPIDGASAQRVLDAHAKGTVYLDDTKLGIFQSAANLKPKA